MTDIMKGVFSTKEDASTLFIGLVCLDIVNVMECFPKEDVANYCSDCMWQRGGNAGNSSTVFSILGGKSRFFGTVPTSRHTAFLTDDFKDNNVSFDNCVTVPNSSCPITIVILNRGNGTRTCLHTNKDLREMTFDDFKSNIDLITDKIGWIHFELRDSAPDIARVLSYVEDFNQRSKDEGTTSNGVITSLEAEQLQFTTTMDTYNLWVLPDVMFVSKDFAEKQGYNDMETAVRAYKRKVKSGAVVVCAWGADGAAAISADGDVVTSHSFPPPKVVDTCGAGDTFNAAVIRALCQGKGLKEAVTFGCRVAGAKCGIQGFNGLKEFKFE